MGLHYHLNYIVILFLVHVILHCFAFDLINKKFRRPHHGLIRREKYEYSLNNDNEKPDLYNKTNVSHSLQWKWKRAGTNLNNYKNGNNFLENLKVDTKMQTTITPLLKASYLSLISRNILKSTTPSYIEFDYLDENQDQDQYASSKRLDQSGTDNGITKLVYYKTSRPVIVRSSLVSYHLFNDPYNRLELITPPKPMLPKNHHESLLYPYFQPANNFQINRMGKSTNKVRVSDLITNIPILGQNAVTVKLYSKESRVTTPKNLTTPKLLIESTTLALLSMTPDDKVKFFEIYDKNTLKPSVMSTKFNENSELKSNLTNISSEKNCLIAHNNNGKLRHCDKTNKTKIDENSAIESYLTHIRSEKVIQIAGHNNGQLKRSDNTNKTTIEKKHNYKKRSFEEQRNSAISNQIKGKSVPKLRTNSIANTTFMFQTENIFSKSKIMTKTVMVRWSSYPFASVYVYKPTQTHCDAAGISPHWLLAAGSCLSRHTLVHSLHARSAFVTYCGKHWRRPERVAYVKRSVVHPKFNPRDKVRRLLYNIGLIQVSDSMAASCPRWSPIALMSHQFATQPEGSLASAVGWGLDRYGTKYVTEKLPYWPLTLYDALVYSDTCPGSPEYSMEKSQDGDGARNVYCLLLPPYTKEESDPVHGGLLLVGGKLVALYLQEERRSQGPQSAQYTGVWRLLPWVMDIAREPEDVEPTFDI